MLPLFKLFRSVFVHVFADHCDVCDVQLAANPYQTVKVFKKNLKHLISTNSTTYSKQCYSPCNIKLANLRVNRDASIPPLRSDGHHLAGWLHSQFVRE